MRSWTKDSIFQQGYQEWIHLPSSADVQRRVSLPRVSVHGGNRQSYTRLWINVSKEQDALISSQADLLPDQPAHSCPMGVRACIHACTAPLLIQYHPILYPSSYPVVLALAIEDLCILIPKTSRLQIVCTTFTSSLLTNNVTGIQEVASFPLFPFLSLALDGMNF